MASHMVDVNLPTLLPQKQQPAALGAGDGANGRAWEREMERAQMEQWLAHGIVGYQALVGEAGPSAAATATATSQVQRASGAAGRIQPGSQAVHANPSPDTRATHAGHGAPSAQPKPESEAAQTVPPDAPARAARAGLDGARSGVPITTSAPFTPLAPVTALPPNVPTTTTIGVDPVNDSTPAPAPTLQLRSWTDATQRPARELLVTPAAKQAWEAKPYLERVMTERQAVTHTMEIGALLQPLAAVELSATMNGVALPLAPELAAATATATAPVAPLTHASPASVPVVNASALAMPALESFIPAVSQGQPAAATTTATGKQVQAEATVRGRMTGARAAAPRDESPVRLHADWSESGVKLWLGMHPDLLPQLQAIATHLQRWISAQGLRLLALSCNGRELEGDPCTADRFETTNPNAAAAARHSRRQELS